jgi:hypothetical protein
MVVSRVSGWEKEIYHNHMAKCMDYRDIVDEAFDTATESFASLLQSKNLTGNYAIIKKIK